MAKSKIIAGLNETIDLQQLISKCITQQNLAKQMQMSRTQIQRLLSDPKQLDIYRLEEILKLCEYKLELHLTKIE